jgi:hypothetical protein
MFEDSWLTQLLSGGAGLPNPSAGFPPMQGLDLPPAAAAPVAPPGGNPWIPGGMSPMGGPMPGRGAQDLPPEGPPAPPAGPTQLAAPAAAGAGRQPDLAALLRGVQAPKPPDVVKPSTPHAFSTRQTIHDPTPQIIQLLSAMGNPTINPRVPYGLASAIGGRG